ncbi:flippase [Hippea alviniae]|uniref:flippase n=1 Tax=Hippea alviniae TaxID=1279027 RepID=UPI0003B5FBA0|nr:flippase [Hippea alviniae]
MKNRLINNLKLFTNSEDKKRLLENFFSLSVLQGANYILPLITLPYLVRVLGPEKFGLIAFAQAFIQYFNILTDYGFQLSATREISIHRENKEKVSEIFSSVMIIKFALLILSFIIMTVIVFSFEKFRKDWLIYYSTFGMVVGQVLFPVWFFQGMERMKYITFLNIIAKLIFTVCIFIFIRKVSDYIYVPLINSVGFIVAGISALTIIWKDFNLRLKFPSWKSIKHQLKEGGYIFISRVSISFYTISNTFVLGLLTNNVVVGYYSAAERLVNAVKSLNNVILQVMFPYVSSLSKKNFDRAVRVVRTELKSLLGSEIILCAAVFIVAPQIVLLLFGKPFIESVGIIRILIFTAPVIILSAVIGQQILLNFGMKRLFTVSIVYMSIAHLIILPLLVLLKRATGAAIAVLITESLILSFRIAGLYRERKDIALSLLGG